MILLTIKLIFICALFVLGVTIITQPNMLLHSIRVWAENKSGKVWESFLLCPWCMGSTWSLPAFLFAFGVGVIDKFEWKLLLLYPLVVCGSSIVCGLTWTFYRLMAEVVEYFKNLNEN